MGFRIEDTTKIKLLTGNATPQVRTVTKASLSAPVPAAAFIRAA
jgi:hypothetical protein